MMQELNHCTKVWSIMLSTLPRIFISLQQLVQANVRVAQAAELATKYRKNVLYNLEASGLVSDSKDGA